MDTLQRLTALGLALGCLAGASFTTCAFTPEDHLAWLKANQSAKPQFVDGDVITYDKADLVRPFIPAEQQSSVLFDGMNMVIKDAGDLSPSDAYKAATAKFAGQAKIASDGAIENYTAGRPFDPALAPHATIIPSPSCAAGRNTCSC